MYVDKYFGALIISTLGPGGTTSGGTTSGGTTSGATTKFMCVDNYLETLTNNTLGQCGTPRCATLFFNS